MTTHATELPSSFEDSWRAFVIALTENPEVKTWWKTSSQFGLVMLRIKLIEIGYLTADEERGLPLEEREGLILEFARTAVSRGWLQE